MLNSVTQATVRSRLAPEERRRQLLGIGLRMLVEKPIQELSLDAVAAEAGISRSLLFHYFPTKSDYYDAVIGAALRRVLRNVSPDDDAAPDEALQQFLERYFAQVERRREFYLALVFGNGSMSLDSAGIETHRRTLARRVMAAIGLDDESALPVMHAWTAYVEDRCLQWSGQPAGSRSDMAKEVARCARALPALLAVEHGH